MGTLNAFYVKGGGNAAVAAVRAAFPEASIEPGARFLGVTLSKEEQFEPPPQDKLARLSSDLGTDVIWLSFQSFVDAFQFHRWYSGALSRSLVFGCFGTDVWNHVEGQPEPWEQKVFFDQETLEFLLQEARSAEEERKYTRMWQGRELVPGREEPVIDARESARKVAKYYGFPGWS